jgi:hypothetical protein
LPVPNHSGDHVDVLHEQRRRVLFQEAGRLPQVHGDHFGQVALLLEQAELQLDDALDSVFERILRLGDFPENGEKPPDTFLEDRDQDVVLVLEVEIDRAVGDARRLGDLAHPRRIKAILGEDLDRCLEDPIPLVGRPLALVGC